MFDYKTIIEKKNRAFKNWNKKNFFFEKFSYPIGDLLYSIGIIFIPILFLNLFRKKLSIGLIFINITSFFSLVFLFAQVLLNNFIVPKSLDQAREFIRNSNIDFFPSLIKEKKFIDAVESLTIFVETKNKIYKYINNIFIIFSVFTITFKFIYCTKIIRSG